MKMAKWYLEDSIKDGTGEVFVLKGESLEDAKHRKIYKVSRVEFYLIYSAQEKMIGYLLRYRYDENFPKFCLFNSFGVVYNKKEAVNPENLSFEVIFEDQVIRLLAFEHPNKVKDYMLVGRWRPTSTDKIIDDREERGDRSA